MPNRCPDSNAASKKLLGADDLPPFVVTNRGGVSPFLLLGDHAGRAVPRSLGDLGIPSGAMERHIAWDIGIAGLGARLAASLDACFVEQTYSRLVVDCNRQPDAWDATPEVSDDQAIPDNLDLTTDDRAQRWMEIQAPYQDEIQRVIGDRRARGQPTVLISLHSFTPFMAGFQRPWLYGVLHRKDSPFSDRALAWLRQRLGEAVIGDNEPYALDDREYTIPRHADGFGLEYLELEVRQDLLADDEGQGDVCQIVAALLGASIRSD